MHIYGTSENGYNRPIDRTSTLDEEQDTETQGSTIQQNLTVGCWYFVFNYSSSTCTVEPPLSRHPWDLVEVSAYRRLHVTMQTMGHSRL